MKKIGSVRLALLLVAAIFVNVVSASGIDLGGAFALTAQDGRKFGDKDLAGRPYAIFFGFTSCPEVCPTTLGELSVTLSDLGDDAGKFTPVFVTVDPERDTPERLSEYLGSFDQRIVGLSGSPEQIAGVARLFKATYAKIPTSDGSYIMDHTAIIYLMDANGRFFDKVEYGEDQESQLRKIRALLGLR